MMSWQAWAPPDGWPANAPSVRWQELGLDHGHDARLWLFDLDAPTADALAFTACLSAAEIERAARFRQPLHGRRHRVARAMLRHLLAHLTQQHAAELRWQTGPHGKPHLGDARGSLHFNLSHSEGWALLATSSTVELGVDLEELAAKAHLADMASRILCPQEQDAFTAIAGSDANNAQANDLLLTTWVRKEACLKALGCGLIRDMNTITLSDGLAQTSAHARSSQGEMPSTHWRDVALPPDCQGRAALAWGGHPQSLWRDKG